jgi:hypothetical protein
MCTIFSGAPKHARRTVQFNLAIWREKNLRPKFVFRGSVSAIALQKNLAGFTGTAAWRTFQNVGQQRFQINANDVTDVQQFDADDNRFAAHRMRQKAVNLLMKSTSFAAMLISFDLCLDRSPVNMF